MRYAKRCIVTGAAGFIGSALVRLLLKETDATVLVVDKLTYAGVPESLKEVGLNPDDLTSSNPRLPARHDLPSRGGIARRSFDRRTGRVHPHQCRRHRDAATGRAEVVEGPS